MKPILYLAGPINACSDTEAMDWRQTVKARLSDCYEFLDPMARDYRGKEDQTFAEIVKGDIGDILAADVIFANCPKPSVGTSMEVFYAYQNLSKPVIVVAPTPMSPWLRYFSDVQYAKLDAGITYARTICKEIVKAKNTTGFIGWGREVLC